MVKNGSLCQKQWLLLLRSTKLSQWKIGQKPTRHTLYRMKFANHAWVSAFSFVVTSNLNLN